MSEQSIKDLLARLDERTERMADDIAQLKHVLLEGNGSPPMTVQVATMDVRLKAVEEEKKDAKIPRHVSVGIMVSIILAGVSILAAWVQG